MFSHACLSVYIIIYYFIYQYVISTSYTLQWQLLSCFVFIVVLSKLKCLTFLMVVSYGFVVVFHHIIGSDLHEYKAIACCTLSGTSLVKNIISNEGHSRTILPYISWFLIYLQHRKMNYSAMKILLRLKSVLKRQTVQ